MGQPWTQPDFASQDFVSIFENFEVGRDFVEQTLGFSKDDGSTFGWVEDAMGLSGSARDVLDLLNIDTLYLSSVP